MKWSLAAKKKQLDGIVRRELARAGQKISSDVKIRMRAPGKSGRSRKPRSAPHGTREHPMSGRRAWKGKRHISSARGQAPAVDQSELVNSISYSVVETYGVPSEVKVGPATGGEKLLKRARHLEAPDELDRPAFLPALRAEQGQYAARLLKATKELFR